jgi:hypothetical protein
MFGSVEIPVLLDTDTRTKLFEEGDIEAVAVDVTPEVSSPKVRFDNDTRDGFREEKSA